MIKCPYCGKSHFKVNETMSTLVAVPLIISEGKVEQRPNPNKTTHNCTCLECHKDFTTNEDILAIDDSPIECNNVFVGDDAEKKIEFKTTFASTSNEEQLISLNGDTTTAVLKIDPNATYLSTSCLICGESVKIKNPNDTPKICDKCKEAVLRVRGWKEDNIPTPSFPLIKDNLGLHMSQPNCETCPYKGGLKDAFGNPVVGDSPCDFCPSNPMRIICGSSSVKGEARFTCNPGELFNHSKTIEVEDVKGKEDKNV